MRLKISFLCAVSLWLITVFFSGCSKSIDLERNIEDDNLTEVKSLVSTLGFDTVNLKLDGDKIIVEGDILLYKSKLSKTTPRQASGFQGPLIADNNMIKYFIPQALSNADAIESAFNEYGSLQVPSNFPILLPSAAFYFTRVYSEAEANVVITTYYSDNLKNYGYADFPTLLPALGIPHVPYPRLRTGKYISINVNAWNNINWSQKKFLIAHEFGHAIGLRHTDWKRSEPASAYENGVLIGSYTIPFTPNSSKNPDPNSVFNSGSGTTPFAWNGFTNFDKTAIFYVANGK